jgi:hypothetical protein
MGKFDTKKAKDTKEFPENSIKKEFTKPNENSVKKEKEKSNGNLVVKETLNEFKKKAKQFETKEQPVVPHSAFHLYCARVRKMTADEREEQFGDIDSLSKLEQVKKISSQWKTTENELKLECLEEFKQELEKYKAKKQKYEQKMNEFQLNGDSNTIYIGNLASVTTKESIQEVCEQFGEIAEVRIVAFKGKKPINPFGFVEFTSANAAKQALQLDQSDLDGQTINVKLSAANKAATPIKEAVSTLDNKKTKLKGKINVKLSQANNDATPIKEAFTPTNASDHKKEKHIPFKGKNNIPRKNKPGVSKKQTPTRKQK